MGDAYTHAGSWRVVDQAVAILAARYGIRRAQAYEILRSATNDGRPIGDVAKRVVAAADEACDR